MDRTSKSSKHYFSTVCQFPYSNPNLGVVQATALKYMTANKILNKESLDNTLLSCNKAWSYNHPIKYAM